MYETGAMSGRSAATPEHSETAADSCDCFQSRAADERDSRRRYAETNAGEGSGCAYYSGFIKILLLWAEPVLLYGGKPRESNLGRFGSAWIHKSASALFYFARLSQYSSAPD